jgi:hypothetical protein
MNFGYAQPFSFRIVRPEAKGAQPAKPAVAGIRHGVTEITLGDGRVVRATLQVKDVKPNPDKPGSLDISYNVVAEIAAGPDAAILPPHETLQ